MSHASSPFPIVRRLGLALVAASVFTVITARAQDAIRPSLAGESAAEARRQSIDKIPYNLEVGPIKFRFSATGSSSGVMAPEWHASVINTFHLPLITVPTTSPRVLIGYAVCAMFFRSMS